MNPIVIWKLLNINILESLTLVTYSVEVEDNGKKASVVQVYSIENAQDITVFNSLTEEEKITWIKQRVDTLVEDKLLDSLYN